MDRSDIVVPYFIYNSNYPWAEACLRGQDVSTMIKRIEEGASPFEVIPWFRKDIFQSHMQFSFPCGFFENRIEMHSDDAIYDKRVKPEQIGKLFVPHYNTMSAKEVRDGIEMAGSPYIKREFRQTLSNHPNTELFYRVSMMGELKPLDKSKVFVLRKEQLE